jgi:hypothetical protein
LFTPGRPQRLAACRLSNTTDNQYCSDEPVERQSMWRSYTAVSRAGFQPCFEFSDYESDGNWRASHSRRLKYLSHSPMRTSLRSSCRVRILSCFSSAIGNKYISNDIGSTCFPFIGLRLAPQVIEDISIALDVGHE